MCRCAPPRTKEGGRRAGDRAPISGWMTAPALPPTSARSRARAACRPRGRLSALRRRTSGAASRGGAGAWAVLSQGHPRPAALTSTPRPKWSTPVPRVSPPGCLTGGSGGCTPAGPALQSHVAFLYPQSAARCLHERTPLATRDERRGAPAPRERGAEHAGT